MKKSDLKQLIKPLVKECIHEVLLEEGLLSNVVAEVAKGMQGNLVVETKQKQKKRIFNEEMQMQRQSDDSRKKINEHRQKLMKSIGAGAYNGVDLFEGTQPMQAERKQQGGPDLGDPGDAGVDISSIMGQSSKIWNAMK